MDMTERIRGALVEAAIRAFEDAGVQGLCTEGRWEAAVGAMRALALKPEIGGGAMRQTANARFTIQGWNENAYSEGEGQPKMTRAAVVKTYMGDITGEGRVEYLMMYRGDGTAAFVGLERIVGRLADRTGSFVLLRTGAFEDGLAKESYTVVSGSATGELSGLAGEGTSAVGPGMEHPFTLAYELP